MILDGVSFGVLWFTFFLDSPVSLYDMPSSSLPMPILNNMKPEEENVFQYCEMQERTHEPRSILNNRQNCSWDAEVPAAEIAAESTQPDPYLCQLNPGEKPLFFPTATAHTEKCVPLLWRTELCFSKCFSGSLRGTHLLFGFYWVIITFLLPYFLHRSKAKHSTGKHTVYNFDFFYPRTPSPCAAGVKHCTILLASKAMCIYCLIHLEQPHQLME